MPEPSDDSPAWEAMRAKVIGLGERSIRKTYYPELVHQVAELERFRALLDQSRDAIFLLEAPSYRIVDATLSACSQSGYSHADLLSRSLSGLLPIEAVESIRACVTDQTQAEHGCTISTVLWKGDGERLPIEISVRPVVFNNAAYAVAVARDITERLELEARLVQVAKMESLGQLAGGVAHDFNNLLTAIIGNAEMARSDLPPGHPALEAMVEIIAAAERAAALVRQLLAFASRQIISPVRLNLSSVVTESERMLRRLLREDIEIVTVLEPYLGTIEADPSQMQQLLVNLTVNARDAMSGAGRLVIETANVAIEPSGEATRGELGPGRYVELAVTDTGTGMSPDTIAHIFEPFYTTKAQGEGTGLGLATCHGIVKQSGGEITVISEPGVGTTFRILLPCVDATPDASVDREHEPHASRGTETILIVEDEEIVRRLMVLGLRAHGYTVLEAANGDAALDLASSRRIDLVVSDVVMPGMNGVELAQRIADILPMAGLILASGYAEPSMLAWARTANGDSAAGETSQATALGLPAERRVSFLSKPFTPKQLAREVRQVLDAHPTG